jgi:hypothetical protein
MLGKMKTIEASMVFMILLSDRLLSSESQCPYLPEGSGDLLSFCHRGTLKSLRPCFQVYGESSESIISNHKPQLLPNVFPEVRHRIFIFPEAKGAL